MLRFLFITIVFINFLQASQKDDDAKFLVLDNQTYSKIKILNILNGGIDKKYLISSSRLSNSDLIKYYPEYYLYNAEQCYIINNITIGKKNTTINIKKIKDENSIKKEIKKIKLLQMLSDNNSNAITSSNISPKIIKSLGYICNSKLIFKNKSYEIEDTIGNFVIKMLDNKAHTIRLEVK